MPCKETAISAIGEEIKPESTTVEDVVPKLSSDARRLLAFLSNIGSKWIELGLFLEVGEELGNHGVVDEGRDTLQSAIGELRRERLVEFQGESDDGPIRITPGITFMPVWMTLNEGKYYNIGCRMLFVGVGLLSGLTHLRDHMNAFVESAREMVAEPELEMREEIWGILSAGLCALGRAHEAYGDDLVAEELIMLSFGYRLTSKATEKRGHSNFARPGGFRISFYSLEFDVPKGCEEDGDIGLYSARRWIEGEAVESEDTEHKNTEGTGLRNE